METSFTHFPINSQTQKAKNHRKNEKSTQKVKISEKAKTPEQEAVI